MASSQYWAAGKSINAQRAESEGKFPKTIFKQKYGIDPTILVTSSEWHHSSKFFNKVDYYSIEDVMGALAEMPYNERQTYIKSAKFKAYWLANRFDYLSYDKPSIYKNKPIVSDMSFNYYQNSEFRVLGGEISDKKLFKIIYKKLADKKRKLATRDLLEKIDLRLSDSSVWDQSGQKVSSFLVDLNKYTCIGESASGKTLFFKKIK